MLAHAQVFQVKDLSFSKDLFFFFFLLLFQCSACSELLSLQRVMRISLRFGRALKEIRMSRGCHLFNTWECTNQADTNQKPQQAFVIDLGNLSPGWWAVERRCKTSRNILPWMGCLVWGICIDRRQQRVSCLQSEQEEMGVTCPWKVSGDSFLESNSRPTELADTKPSSYSTDGRIHQGAKQRGSCCEPYCSKMQTSFLMRRGFLLCFARLWKRGKSALEHTFSLPYSPYFPVCLTLSVSHLPLLIIKVESLGNSGSREKENENYL